MHSHMLGECMTSTERVLRALMLGILSNSDSFLGTSLSFFVSLIRFSVIPEYKDQASSLVINWYNYRCR